MSINAVDVLVHFSNILMLASYSVRDILWLRWFAVAAAVTVVPYYIVQHDILWPPIFWGSVFTAINLFQIARIYAERRPVVLSPDEQSLYSLGFQALRPREFVALTLVGEWKDAIAGDEVLTEGRPVSALCVAITGTMEVRREDRSLGMLKPGHIVGLALALTGRPSPISAAFTGSGRYICWPFSSLSVFLEKKPELRTALQQLVSRDLAHKVEALTAGAHPGAVGR